MTSYVLPIVVAVGMAILCVPLEVCTKSVGSAENCDGRKCSAGKGFQDGKCFCCINCTLFNRQSGNDSCVDSKDGCGSCLPGFEVIPNIKDRCREVHSTSPRIIAEEYKAGKPMPVQSGGPSHGPDWSAVLSIIAVAGVVVVVAAGTVYFVRRGNLHENNGKPSTRSQATSKNSSSNSLPDQVELMPLKKNDDESAYSSWQGSNEEEPLQQARTPVEDSDCQSVQTPSAVQDPPRFVFKSPESLQNAVPINSNEAAQNPAQSFAPTLNEPVENDESMHSPSAPPFILDALFPNGSMTCPTLIPQNDSGFQTHMDSDDAHSMASTYSNATTAVVGATSPQGSPISPEQSDEAVNSDEGSPSFTSGSAPNTSLPEGMSLNLEVFARVNFQN